MILDNVKHRTNAMPDRYSGIRHRLSQTGVREPMGIEAILGGIAFAGLFGLWVILPSKVRKSKGQ